MYPTQHTPGPMSKASSKLNSHVFYGVDGMPTTHQVGFGDALNHGLNPATIDVDEMERKVHAEMAATAAAGVATIVLARSQPELAIVTGLLTLIGVTKLKNDWNRGFEAPNYLPQSYFEHYPPLRTRTRRSRIQ